MKEQIPQPPWPERWLDLAALEGLEWSYEERRAILLELKFAREMLRVADTSARMLSDEAQKAAAGAGASKPQG